MAGNVRNLVNSIRGLSLADQAPELTGSKLEHGDAATAPVEAIQKLIQSANATTTQAKHVRTLDRIKNFPRDSKVAELNTLRTRAKELARVTQALTNSVERNIAAHITQMVRPVGIVQRMLEYFDKEIGHIIQGILDRSSNDGNIAWKLVEECYNQSLNESGTL